MNSGAMLAANHGRKKSARSMIRKSGYRFSEKIMLEQKKIKRDGFSTKSHPAPGPSRASRRDIRHKKTPPSQRERGVLLLS
jgi:hypothetical protein